MAGAPVRVVRDRPVEEVVEEVKAELAEIEVETAENGVVVKADTLGSLEAMANALEAEVPILRAEVGDIAPRDIAVAETANQDEHKAIPGFNVDLLANAETELENADVKLFTDEVIYQLIEDYETYVEEKQRAQQETVLDKVVRPSRFRILPPTTRSARTTPRSSASRSSPARFRTTATSDTSRVTSSSASASSPAFKKGRATTSTRRAPRAREYRHRRPDRRARHRGGRHSLDRNPRKHAKILEQELKERSRPTSARRSRRTWRPSGSGTLLGK